MLAALPISDAGLLDVNGTLIAEVLAFLAMLAVLGRWVYPRIMAAATERQDRIEAGLRAAEEAEKRLRAVQADVETTLEEARGRAREVISRAHQEAAAEGEEVRKRARQDAEAQVDKARADIAVERDRALQELRTQVSGMVVDAAGRVLGEAIDRRAHQRLIEEALAEVRGEGGGS